MPSAEIITIGTEILLGEILDTNARSIARHLRDLGIDLYRKTTVGDNTNRIAQAIQQALERCEIVLTTGGLGPTVDDPTRQAVALAVGHDLEFRPELWDQILARYKRFGRLPTNNNKRQAYIPIGAQPIENPVGTAPAFLVESEGKIIISLPGVPHEMDYLLVNTILPLLRERYHLTSIIKSRSLHTIGVGESQIDDLIGDLETLTNPTVGLAAHSGQVDVRITAKAEGEAAADKMIAEIEAELRKRLGVCVYGIDQETLEEAALVTLKKHGWRLAVVEQGTGGDLGNRLAAAKTYLPKELVEQFLWGEVRTELEDEAGLMSASRDVRSRRGADVCLGAGIFTDVEGQYIRIVLLTPDGERRIAPRFGGSPEFTARFVVQTGLDLVRRMPDSQA